MIIAIKDKEKPITLDKTGCWSAGWALLLSSMQQRVLPAINILLWVSIYVLSLPLLTEHTATQVARWHGS